MNARMPSLNRGAAASTRKAISGEDYYAEDLARLREEVPHWDQALRVDGAIRRLARDSSDKGFEKVVAIFGTKTAEIALSIFKLFEASRASAEKTSTATTTKKVERITRAQLEAIIKAKQKAGSVGFVTPSKDFSPDSIAKRR